MFTLKVWIQWQTSSRFALASNHDHKSSRSNQAHWQALLCYMYAYTGPPNKRFSVHSVVMGHVRTTYLKTGSSTISTGTDSTTHGRIFVGSKLQRLQRQTSDSGVSRFRGVHFVQSRRIASELKARAVFTLATSARARGRNRFGNLLRTQVCSGPKPATAVHSPGALLSLKSC
jgi:hypothetical protein